MIAIFLYIIICRIQESYSPDSKIFFKCLLMACTLTSNNAAKAIIIFGRFVNCIPSCHCIGSALDFSCFRAPSAPLKMIVIHKRYEKRATIRSFFVTLQEFSAFLYIKAVWGIDENLGYELETVLNSTFYYEMHSMNTRRCATSRFNDSSSGAKVNISFERTKSIFNFFIWACSSLISILRHLLWHLLEKCVLGYVLLP